MGYIKLFRKIQDWGWYDDPNTLALWVHLLVDANWKDNAEWHGETIERGSLITSVAKLSADTGLSDRQVRTALSHLVSTGEIVMKATNKWTKITICKYDTYQSASLDECQADDEQPTNNRQADDKQPTTLEESNKGKKKEGNKESDSSAWKDAVERIYDLYPTKCPISGRATGKSSKDKQRIESLLKKGLTEEMLSATIKRYIEESKTSTSYIKNFSTFLNNIPDYSQPKTQDASGDGQAPAKLTKEQDIWMAAHPTKEEIKKWFEENFYPFHLKNDGETDEAYFVRIRPDYEAAKKRWIDNRVLYRKQKY